MLNRTDVQRPRRSAISSQFDRRARGRRVAALFTGGPLDQVRTTLPAESDDSVYLGFCVVTDRGPVQALYTRGDGSDWRFAELFSGALRRRQGSQKNDRAGPSAPEQAPGLPDPPGRTT